MNDEKKKIFKEWWQVQIQNGNDWSWRNKPNTYPATQDKKQTWDKKKAKKIFKLMVNALEAIENLTYEEYLAEISAEPSDQLQADTIELIKHMRG